MQFSELDLNPTLLEGLTAINFHEATPIQAQAIPLVLQNRDLIACAQTGTGKTAAFLVPVINKLMDTGSKDVNTLIIVPTRELAVQIDQMLQGLAYFTPVSSIAMYGGGDGASFTQQKKALTEGADIVVSTPGKLISHLNMNYARLDNLQHLVLDEADKMLDMGFYEDIVRIIKHLPEERQTLMFSATMPNKIRKLAKEILKDPAQIDIAVSKPAQGVTQIAYQVYEANKNALVRHILRAHPEFKSVIIFSSKKSVVKDLARELGRDDASIREIHSDLEQVTREDYLREFKNKQCRVLIGTDVISRGIDVEGVDLVINYEVPKNLEEYVHRVGRTARASTQGFAFTLVNEREQFSFQRIEEDLETEITRFDTPEYIGETPTEKRKGDGQGPWKRKMRKGGNNRRRSPTRKNKD